MLVELAAPALELSLKNYPSISTVDEDSLGIASQLGVADAELQQRLAKGVQAIVDECEAHGSNEDKALLRHVLHLE